MIDVGNMMNACAVSALYAAETVFLVTNPDVPSIRNAQRLIDRVRQLGAGSERVKILLNRVSDQHLIAPKQIETALGYGIHHTFASDYRTVSEALNSGVPLSMTNNSDLFPVRQLHAPAGGGAAGPKRSRSLRRSGLSSVSSDSGIEHEHFEQQRCPPSAARGSRPEPPRLQH